MRELSFKMNIDLATLNASVAIFNVTVAIFSGIGATYGGKCDIERRYDI
jgi:hypothetical protein